MKDQKGLGIVDTIIVCMLVSAFIVVVIPYYKKIALEAQRSALRAELGNIRMSLELYKVLTNQYPEDLRVLLKKRYMFPARNDTFFKEEFLNHTALDKEGYPLDPFGNRFQYNSRTGKLSSSTEGYEKW